jgi:hypothetical protein
MAAHLTLAPRGETAVAAPTTVALFDQGLTQVLQAAVTGLAPKHAYDLALASRPDGSGALQILASFKTNPAGSAIVDAVGPIRQIVHDDRNIQRRYLVITEAGASAPIQVQTAR